MNKITISGGFMKQIHLIPHEHLPMIDWDDYCLYLDVIGNHLQEHEILIVYSIYREVRRPYERNNINTTMP